MLEGEEHHGTTISAQSLSIASFSHMRRLKLEHMDLHLTSLSTVSVGAVAVRYKSTHMTINSAQRTAFSASCPAAHQNHHYYPEVDPFSCPNWPTLGGEAADQATGTQKAK